MLARRSLAEAHTPSGARSAALSGWCSAMAARGTRCAWLLGRELGKLHPTLQGRSGGERKRGGAKAAVGAAAGCLQVLQGGSVDPQDHV